MEWVIKGAASGVEWAYHTIIIGNALFPARVNPVMFYLLWTYALILVSMVSFFVFVMQGSELIVSVPFIVRALFSTIIGFGCSP